MINPRRGLAAVGAAAVVAMMAMGGTSLASPSATTAAAIAPPPGGFITNFVKYTHGSAKTANSSLAPVKIGWSSVDNGGSITSIGPEATGAAVAAVQWLNKYANGIDGHPIELDQCIILNAEEEGLTCAEKFLGDKHVDVIAYGALTTGGTTIDDTVAGKKPIIEEFMLNPSDLTTKNLYALFGGSNFTQYPTGGFAQQYLHAKTASIIYPNQPGEALIATSAEVGLKYAGIKTKLVDFDPTATDLTGPVTAAGATTADIVYDLATSPAQCLESAKAMSTLGVSATKVLWQPQCEQPSIKSQFPGGDYPKYWQSIAQSGDAFAADPTGVAFKKALGQVGAAGNWQDDWYSAVWGQILTIAQFMNKIGYSHLSTSAISAQVKSFRGPLLLGGPDIQCGRYKFAPGSCSDGNYFFHYLGNGKYFRSSWIEEPAALRTKLEALKPGAPFPTA
jgi:branched-chain amino acid transport system substrate-binding protein